MTQEPRSRFDEERAAYKRDILGGDRQLREAATHAAYTRGVIPTDQITQLLLLKLIALVEAKR